MLNATFNSDNGFTLADVRKPTATDSTYGLKLAIREYGQIDVVIPASSLTPAQVALISEAELGYPLSDYLGGNRLVLGNFSRYRKTATSAVSLQFNVTSIADVV